MRLRLMLAATLVAALPLSGRAQDDEQQRAVADMRTAASYASRAAVAQARDEVRFELQQVLNCLEGRKGADYRKLPNVDTACHEDGAVNELSAQSLNKTFVQQAIKLATVAMTLDEFDAAHFASQAVQAVLLAALRNP